MDTATITWEPLTKTLINDLAKSHDITPAEVVTLMKFATMGGKRLRERAKAKAEEQARNVAA
jgi:hypothetical protein